MSEIRGNGLSLNGRTAFITGVSRCQGIGFAIARQLAKQGADLCIHSFSPYDSGKPWGKDVNDSDKILSELEKFGGRVTRIESDLSVTGEPERVIAGAYGTLGHLDILVVNHAHSEAGTLGELSEAHIDRHLAVNVRASLLLMKSFAEKHDGRPGGRIVLMTSGQHLNPMSAELAYIASKGALHQLTLSLSACLAPQGITVNTVNPGATDTGYATGELYDAVCALEPMGRWGQPEDAARLIGWLATDEARWITGQVINSTGGGP